MSSIFTDTASWAAIAGLVLPLLVAVVNQPTWSPTLKRVVAVAASVIAAVLTCLGNGTLDDGKTVFEAFVLILVTSQALYGTLFHSAAKTVEAKVLNFAPKHLGGQQQDQAA